MTIQENTFAEACYNSNSIEELEAALDFGPDYSDMQNWNISEEEYYKQIKIALGELKDEK